MSTQQATLSTHDTGSLAQDGIVAYECQVMHQRLRPFTYQFRYRIMSLCIDVDAFHQRLTTLSWLGFNRFRLMSIHTRDFGARNGSAWRPWLTKLLAEYGLDNAPARIVLACMPRCLGVGFNPLAMWYAYNDSNELIAVVAEVSNTFGHHHHYVLCDGGKTIHRPGKTLKATAEKAFHVSPFLGMSCRYHFAMSVPTFDGHQPYVLTIRESEDGENTLIAAQTGKPVHLPQAGFGIVRLGYWLSSFKTLAAIHWWALKIVCKGGKFRRTPKPQRQKTYGHSRLYLE